MKLSGLLEAGLFTLSLALFGLFSVSYLPAAFMFLAIGVLLMFRNLRNTSRLQALFGIDLRQNNLLFGLLVGVITGVVAVFTYRLAAGQDLWVFRFGRFAGMAFLIGVTEELVFRGYLQSRIMSYGPVFSVVFTAVAHTLYKMALLLPFPSIQIIPVVGWTLGAGLVLGFMRVYFRNVMPSAINHGLFDLLIYGGRSSPPWWVW